VFNRLFVRSDALTRQLSAALADERCQYLANCEEQGMSKSTLRSKARILLSIADYLKLAHRPQGQISMQEIEKAASRWSRKRCSPPSKCLREGFVSEAVAWLSFVGRLQVQAKPAKAYDQMVVEFKAFMEKDRGLSPVTVEHRCHSVRPFLDRLLSEKRSLDMISVADQPYAVATGNQKSRGLFPGEKSRIFPANRLAATSGTRFRLQPQHAFYRVVGVDLKGNQSGASAYVADPRPFIYSERPAEARVGKSYRYEVKTIASIGDLTYRDFGAEESYQAAFWDADQPRFSLNVEMPRCGNFDPKWLRIDSATGVVTGTPGLATAASIRST
jgi:hypothetical protein